MSQLNYCISCGEAVITDSFISNLKETGGWSRGLTWDIKYFSICENENCKLFGVMVRRISKNPPSRLKKSKKRDK